MNMTRLLRFVIVGCASLILLGCSSLPDTLKTDNPNLVTDYQVWQSAPQAEYALRLGGVIAAVTNFPQQTRIEVVNLPINASGKPDINQEPNGRFVAYIKGFADPVALSEGRLVTFLGAANGSEKGQVGQFDYDFPVMDASQYHLWRIEERVIVNDVGSYMYPCRDVHCRNIHSSTRQGRVIQEVR
ncbi:Slp family lipoprotein [Vibrio renipiscarius]|uniref:Starvation-inducible protein n=1 Tax=Vibrio renipiscarius TaxID=1461322 RepID=A0A0C2JNQ8_9VIBR|nr:Slp family lipoprotein [Vibrio renipiscarius]KII79699.1 starvation-inducible protein [Vibrio renipiscarius]KII80674.1 starvation-inducible protein [Vibrio renipiscarius]